MKGAKRLAAERLWKIYQEESGDGHELWAGPVGETIDWRSDVEWLVAAMDSEFRMKGGEQALQGNLFRLQEWEDLS